MQWAWYRALPRKRFLKSWGAIGQIEDALVNVTLMLWNVFWLQAISYLMRFLLNSITVDTLTLLE